MEYKYTRDWSNAPKKIKCDSCDTDDSMILTVKEDTQRRIYWTYECNYRHCKAIKEVGNVC